MRTANQQALLEVIGHTLDLTPEMRLGQLVANLTWLAGADDPEAVANIDDGQMLVAARENLRAFQREISAIRAAEQL